jgi:ABC-2 type transport system ATP-binding protein
MKQRLVFAGALLPDPELLVIDEPMVGLDPQGHQTVKDLFTSLAHEENKTILLSTHTLGVAEEVCDELVIINEGDIIARGTLDELSLEAGSEEKRLEEVFLNLTERANSEAVE